MALSRVFIALYPKSSVLESFFGHVAYQGLLRVCSQPALTNELTAQQTDLLGIFVNMLDEQHITRLKAVSYSSFPLQDRVAMQACL